jgi:hypothetical protein
MTKFVECLMTDASLLALPIFPSVVDQKILLTDSFYGFLIVKVSTIDTRGDITKRTMKVFKRIKDAFPLRRLEETFGSTQSLKDQFGNMFLRTLWYEYALSLVEREIYLEEEIAALKKQRTTDGLTPDREKILNDWQKEIQCVDPIWWRWERGCYKLAMEEPTGRRIYDFNKNFSSAMASKKAKLHCRMRGGCCTRNCGCCSKERRTNRPKVDQLGQYIGHCTRNCGCCTRYNRRMGVTDQDIDISRELMGASVLTHHPVYPLYREIRGIENRMGENFADTLFGKDIKKKGKKKGTCSPRPAEHNSAEMFLYRNYPTIFQTLNLDKLS